MYLGLVKRLGGGSTPHPIPLQRENYGGQGCGGQGSHPVADTFS